MLTQENIPKFDPETYNNIALNDLVTYAVFFLTQEGERISSENITAASFLLFPERFALRGYPRWPDSTVVNKRWIDCRNKGLIMGSTAQDFSLTPKGLTVAERVSKFLQGKKQVITRGKLNKVRTEIRTRGGRFLRSIEDSVAYKRYKKEGEQANIAEFDFRSMLMCTMDSTSKTLRENLEQFKQYANGLNRQDILFFLEFCTQSFIYLLIDKTNAEVEHKRGMMQRKTRS